MRIQITARHCDIPDAVRRRAETRIGKLVRYQPRLGSADIVFEEERHLRKAEGVLQVDGASPVVARGEDQDFRGALDKMVDRLQRILREQRARHTDHQAHTPPKLAAD